MNRRNKKERSQLLLLAQQGIKAHTLDQVFRKQSKSKVFQKTYREELARLRLAQRIRELRLKKNMTQKAVAEKAQMPQSVIARIESGEHSISVDTLGKIASVFNKEVQLV
jgi:DNA-binding XRE family transcriptional regulator